MQINFIGKAKQFVGDSREPKLQKKKKKKNMSGKVSAQTAHTFSHTVVCLLKIYLTHGDVKTTQMHIILEKERETHTHTRKLRYRTQSTHLEPHSSLVVMLQLQEQTQHGLSDSSVAPLKTLWNLCRNHKIKENVLDNKKISTKQKFTQIINSWPIQLKKIAYLDTD